MRGRGSPAGDEFIREVDEAVRQDRWLQLWKQYGSYAIGAAVAIVIGTAAGVGWRNYQEAQRLAEARRFTEATQLLHADHPAEAAQAFTAMADQADAGYGVLARLREAEALGQAGDKAARNAALDRLAKDAAAPPLYRELGDLLAAQDELDQADPATIDSRLERLTAADSPWRHSALELEALAQLRAGQKDAARETLSRLLGDPTTPANMARRAAEVLASLGGPLPATPPAEGSAPTASEAPPGDTAPHEASQ